MRLLLALAVVLLLAPAPAPASSYDPVKSGTTTLRLSPAFTRFLARHDVSIELRGGAERRGRRIVLPAAGGEVDPGAGLASVDSAGTVVFVRGKRRVLFRSVVFKAKRAPLYARVGGSQLKVASAGALKARRQGFGAAFQAKGLRLTAKVATRLDKKLRLGRTLRPGQELGSLAVSVSPRTVRLLPQGRIHLAVDPAFFAKLNDLFVSLNPIAPAELSPGPTLSFPIGPESTLAPDAGLGTVKTGGAAELLQLGSSQIFWREPWLEPGAGWISGEAQTELSSGAGAQPRGPLLSLAPGGAVVATAASRAIQLSGKPVTLTAATAAALDAAFASGESRFAAGELVGLLSTSVTAE